MTGQYLLSPILNASTLFSTTDVPLAGGFIYTYLAGTSTAAATYNAINGTANSNPIVCNSAGQLNNPIWLESSVTYKMMVFDQFNNLVGTYDNISGVPNIGSSVTSQIYSNVKDFGALGNGVTDDTSAIQNAINTGNNIFFPPGLYQVTTLSITNKSGLKLSGAGNEFVSQIRSTVTGNLLQLTNSQNILIEQLTFTPTTGVANTNGIVIDNLSNIIMYNNLIYNFTGPGLSCIGNITNQISGCIIQNNLFLSNAQTTNTAQIDNVYANDFMISDNQIGQQGGSPMGSIGVRLSNCSNGYYADNLVWQNTQGAIFANCLYNRITNNRFEQSQHEGVIFSACSANMIIGNWINANGLAATNTYDACVMNGLTSSVVEGNIVFDFEAPPTHHRNSYIFAFSCSNVSFRNNKSLLAGTSNLVITDNSNTALSFDRSVYLSSATLVTAGQNLYLTSGGLSTNPIGNYTNEGIMIVGLNAALVGSAPGASQSVIFTLVVNGSGTGLTSTISGSNFTNYAVDSIYVAPGSNYCVEVSYSGGAASSNPTVNVLAASI